MNSPFPPKNVNKIIILYPLGSSVEYYAGAFIQSCFSRFSGSMPHQSQGPTLLFSVMTIKCSSLDKHGKSDIFIRGFIESFDTFRDLVDHVCHTSRPRGERASTGMLERLGAVFPLLLFR